MPCPATADEGGVIIDSPYNAMDYQYTTEWGEKKCLHRTRIGDRVTGMPWTRAALDANIVQARSWKLGVLPTVGGPLNVTDARAFLNNKSAVARFTAVYLADALTHGYRGYNFDWELADACAASVCGQVTNADRSAMATFLTGFAAALKPHGLLVSQDVGQAALDEDGSGILPRANSSVEGHIVLYMKCFDAFGVIAR